MPLNKKICPQNKYLRFSIHKFAQTGKSTPKQNSPLKQSFKISPNLPQTEKNAPKYKNLPPKYPELVEGSFFMFEYNTHFLVPPP